MTFKEMPQEFAGIDPMFKFVLQPKTRDWFKPDTIGSDEPEIEAIELTGLGVYFRVGSPNRSFKFEATVVADIYGQNATAVAMEVDYAPSRINAAYFNDRVKPLLLQKLAQIREDMGGDFEFERVRGVLYRAQYGKRG